MPIELKSTLNLPQTPFPMRGNLAEAEPLRLKFWQESKLYNSIQSKAKAAKAPRFILHDGPPFTNGDVHIGTALNRILKDAILRYKSMQGFETPYIPGWDCHGLPIEHKVLQELKSPSASPLPPSEIREACAKFSSSYIEKQTAQIQRLGILAEWDKPYRTMDPAYEAEVLKVLAAFVREGLVYRSKKPVYWSIPCETALAEGEIEYKEHSSPSVYVKFQLIDKDKRFSKPAHLVIWTTTPWTLPANLAIAVHPDLDYVALDTGEEVLIIAKALQASFSQAYPLPPSAQVIEIFQGKTLEGLKAQHPFIDRESLILLADYVTTDSGTGCVHTAPGHGLEDYLSALKYGLEVYCPVDEKGLYVDDGQVPPSLVGASILPKKGHRLANEAVLELLQARGALLKQEPYQHSYPHCWRSKTPLIFRATDQWFIALDKNCLRDKLLKAIPSVQWLPDWGQKRIQGSISSRPDWCISRQRAWGIPLPIFYDEAGTPLLDAGIIDFIAEKIRHLGSQIWFEHSAEALLEGAPPLPPAFKGKFLHKGSDTLDVWIDSGCSHQAVLKTHPELSFPADLYVEGSDQHRGWFQSSLWTSMLAHQSPPYKAILTHGFVVDEDKKKISKSGSKPQSADSYVKRFGADLVRLWVASEDYKDDITLSEGIFQQISQSYRNLRNTFRFILGNLADFNPATDSISPQEWTALDKWAIHELNGLIHQCHKAYEGYEFHKVYQALTRFCSTVLSATYHDILKDRLYTYGPSWKDRRSSQTVLYAVLDTLLRLCAPLLPFTSDEAWCYLTQGSALAPSIHLQPFPEAKTEWSFPKEHADIEALLKFKSQVNEQMEKARQAKTIGQSLDAKVSIRLPQDYPITPLLQTYKAQLPELFIVSQVILYAGTALRIEVHPADGVRCPRSWRWVPELVEAGVFGQVSPRCQEALLCKYTSLSSPSHLYDETKNSPR